MALSLIFVYGCTTPSSPSLKTEEQVKADFAAGRPVVVGVIGNSIGCGYYATGWQQIKLYDDKPRDGQIMPVSENNRDIRGWAQQLQIWLQRRNAKSMVWNLSGSGWTTRHVIERRSLEVMAALDPKPSLVFLALQVNDRLKATVPPGYSTFKEFQENTVRIILLARAHGLTPVLVKEINEPMPKETGWHYINLPGEYRPYADYVKAVDTIAAQYHVNVLDTYTPSLRPSAISRFYYHGNAAPADFRADIMDLQETFDPIHPNQKGHDLIYLQYVKWFRSS